MSYADRIESLRILMRSHGWDAVILTGSDPHSSEYPSERWKQVQWLTGFTGECGDVVVTLDHAGLWTDTRYFIQADKQLEGTGVVLHKMRVPEQVPIPQWLADVFAGDEPVLAVDGICVSGAFVSEIREACTGCDIVSVPDLLSGLWQDRPAIPQTPIFTVDPGEGRGERLRRLRGWMQENDCCWCFIPALDEIAWLLNVRASDIDYNPYVISYLLVGEDAAYWYVLKEAIEDPATERTFDELGAEGIELRRYDEVEDALKNLDEPLLIDSSVLNAHLCGVIKEPVDRSNPVQLWKAVKNPVEVSGMKVAHIKDGLAMEKFLYWLDKCMENERSVTEWDAAVKLGSLRAEIPEYQGDSFETISAWGPGAALPHYITPHSGAPVLEPRGLYLCDSGGQYYSPETFGGTTDITRTVPLGPCSPLEREDYTLVLKGHIGLAMAVFPYGTPGPRLDALSRIPLWSHQRNFGHGTGHGVGWFLGVHEGPHDIRQNMNPEGFVPGMVVSDEPGIYREGQFGVRHENLLLCVDAGTNEFGHWCRFEPLTLCHFDTSIIVRELLTKDELSWLNAYNSKVYEVLSPELPGPVAEWLRAKTAAV